MVTCQAPILASCRSISSRARARNPRAQASLTWVRTCGGGLPISNGSRLTKSKSRMCHTYRRTTFCAIHGVPAMCHGTIKRTMKQIQWHRSQFSGRMARRQELSFPYPLELVSVYLCRFTSHQGNALRWFWHVLRSRITSARYQLDDHYGTGRLQHWKYGYQVTLKAFRSNKDTIFFSAGPGVGLEPTPRVQYQRYSLSFFS